MSGYNTLKQRKFKRAIRKGAKTIAEAKHLAGYSDASITPYQNRKKTQELIDEALPDATPENIENDFNRVKQLCWETKDINNYLRANEDLARIKAMFTDKSISKVDLTTVEEQNIVDRYIKQSRLDAVKLT